MTDQTPLRSAVVSIAAHYNPSRIGFLSSVIRSIFTWQLGQVTVRIVTNDAVLLSEPSIASLIAEGARSNVTVVADIETNLPHPFLLTWAHKRQLREWLHGHGDPTDLFIYLEDDIVVSKENIDYFLRYLPAATALGYIPGFARYENSPAGEHVAVDFSLPQLSDGRDVVEIAGTPFISPRYPYWAGFIMDRNLAAEYLRTASSDVERSATTWPGGVRERSAIGLCFEAPPPGRRSRYVLPMKNGHIDPQCLVWHCAQNYSVIRKENFARIPFDRVLVRRTPIGVAYWLFNYGRIHAHRWNGRFEKRVRGLTNKGGRPSSR